MSTGRPGRRQPKAFSFVFLAAVLTCRPLGLLLASEEGGGGPGGAWKAILVLAGIWLVIIAAVLLNVYRIRRRGREEEEAGLEHQSKEI